jgi:hypothetical protein
MDLTKAIGYRGFLLNTVVKDANQRLVGCETKRVDWPGVQGHGYDEKRAHEDGFDASDVFLGKRLIGLSGGLYGITRGDFYDLAQAFITALTPTAAYDDAPGDRGFMPLDFYVPTMNTVDFPSGLIHKQVFARPVRQPSLIYIDDRTGGDDDQPLSLEWTALMECRDPRVYFFTTTETSISASAGSDSGNLVNKGDYPAPINIMLVVAAASPAGSWSFVGAGTDMTITIPNNAQQQIIRYGSREKLLSLEVAGVETLRMDLLAFNNQKTHPLLGVGTSAYSWTLTTADLAAGGRIWHYDSWA